MCAVWNMTHMSLTIYTNIVATKFTLGVAQMLRITPVRRLWIKSGTADSLFSKLVAIRNPAIIVARADWVG